MGPAVLHAYGFNGARVNTSPAIDAGIRVNDCFAARHADGVAGAFLHTGLTTGAFRFVHFCRHASTLSNRSYESIEKARDHTALLKRLQTKISAKKSTADGLAIPERTASICRVRPGSDLRNYAERSWRVLATGPALGPRGADRKSVV